MPKIGESILLYGEWTTIISIDPDGIAELKFNDGSLDSYPLNEIIAFYHQSF